MASNTCLGIRSTFAMLVTSAVGGAIGNQFNRDSGGPIGAVVAASGFVVAICSWMGCTLYRDRYNLTGAQQRQAAVVVGVPAVVDEEAPPGVVAGVPAGRAVASSSSLSINYGC